MTPRNTEKNKGTLLLYILGFLLFTEWLIPLNQITDTGHINLFIMFAAYTFFLSYLQLPVWLVFPIKTVMILYVIHVLYYTSSIFKPEWMMSFLEIVGHNLLIILQLKWTALTNEFRTLLFLIVLWLISYLMKYWLLYIKKITLFFVLTIIFIAVLDTFTLYDGQPAIFRAILFGFILLALLHMKRVQEREGIQIPKKKYFKYYVSSFLVLIVLSISFAHALPKAGPYWPDPVAFLKAKKSNATTDDDSSFNTKKSGYGEDDSQLGGPFVFDHTPVFTADITEIHYWKVETKDVYTGKGWDVSKEDVVYEIDPNDMNINYQFIEQSVPTESIEAAIQMSDKVKLPFILNPGQLNTVTLEDKYKLDYELNNERIVSKLKENNSLVDVKKYTVQYDFPKFSILQLRNSEKNYPNDIKDRYLQLPESLPDRVGELAKEIVADEDNTYDQARAIEIYFGSGGFVYDIYQVAVPGEDDDYVDQFLFDTKRGYCDNYSTSMVVMLRSIGIPARWVKGFTQGKFDKTVSPGVRRYKVTNANAHSWVEVYFSGVGWVPFEPTRGFNNVYDFVNDDPSTNKDQEEEQQDPSNKEKEEKFEEPDEAVSTGGNGDKSFLNNQIIKWLTTILFILIAVGLYLGFKRRNKLFINYLLYKYKNKNDQESFYDAYRKLLFVLNSCGYKRANNQTLREYAVYIDKHLRLKNMSELTSLYEQGVYRNKGNDDPWGKSGNSYEKILQKLKLII